MLLNACVIMPEPKRDWQRHQITAVNIDFLRLRSETLTLQNALFFLYFFIFLCLFVCLFVSFFLSFSFSSHFTFSPFSSPWKPARSTWNVNTRFKMVLALIPTFFVNLTQGHNTPFELKMEGSTPIFQKKMRRLTAVVARLATECALRQIRGRGGRQA